MHNPAKSCHTPIRAHLLVRIWHLPEIMDLARLTPVLVPRIRRAAVIPARLVHAALDDAALHVGGLVPGGDIFVVGGRLGRVFGGGLAQQKAGPDGDALGLGLRAAHVADLEGGDILVVCVVICAGALDGSRTAGFCWRYLRVGRGCNALLDVAELECVGRCGLGEAAEKDGRDGRNLVEMHVGLMVIMKSNAAGNDRKCEALNE